MEGQKEVQEKKMRQVQMGKFVDKEEEGQYTEISKQETGEANGKQEKACEL